MVYSKLYPEVDVELSRFYFEHKELVIHGEDYLSDSSSSSHSPHIIADWSDQLLHRGTSSGPHLSVGMLKSVFTHSVILKSVQHEARQKKKSLFCPHGVVRRTSKT